MRKNIFGIYKALRHFGITPEEIGGIANAYKKWYHDQHDSLPPYGMVYCLNNNLYSMPYQDDRLNKMLVGIEIAGVVYFTCHLNDVSYDELDNRIEKLKSLISQKFEAVDFFSFKLRMPTESEVKLLQEKTYGEDLGIDLCNKSGNVWINKHHNNTFVEVKEFDVFAHQSSKKTQATLYLVATPNDDDLFIGKLDHFGIPTAQTDMNLRKLLVAAKDD